MLLMKAVFLKYEGRVFKACFYDVFLKGRSFSAAFSSRSGSRGPVVSVKLSARARPMKSTGSANEVHVSSTRTPSPHLGVPG